MTNELKGHWLHPSGSFRAPFTYHSKLDSLTAFPIIAALFAKHLDHRYSKSCLLTNKSQLIMLMLQLPTS